MTYSGVLDHYGHLLDLPAHTRPISLLEGNTPLIPMPRLSAQLGCELFIKYEGLNPSGSFKDRGMTAAISEAAGRGVRTVICASTGNTAASAAAYATRAGMSAIVLIPQGKVAAGKLAGAIAYGARVIQVDGSFDDALALVVQITQREPIALVNSLNPYRLEGQKTAAFEICDILDCPDIPSAQKLRAELMAASKGRRREWRTIRNMSESPAFVKPASLPATVDGIEIDVYKLPPVKLYRLNQDGTPAKVSCHWDHSTLAIQWVLAQTGRNFSLATKDALEAAGLL
jgi:hypothetical protein